MQTPPKGKTANNGKVNVSKGSSQPAPPPGTFTPIGGTPSNTKPVPQVKPAGQTTASVAPGKAPQTAAPAPKPGSAKRAPSNPYRK